tara:strand:- start:1083 stop:1454 length:372 start_codon:yes stop_codon:yes gene_type:complete
MDKLNKLINNLNNSKYMAGIAMIMLNIGSKYIMMELSETQEEIMANKIFRRFIIFTVCFIATRDVVVSLILTGVFVILVSNLFNENSKYCIIKKNKTFKQISKEDYMKATKIKELYELQNKKN